MTIRTDITIDASVSPRIITVDDTSAEMTIQDLHDTLRDAEAAAIFIDEPPFINTAGLEALGGEVTVGLTATLQNMQLQFAGRTAPTEAGSCTSDDSTGKVLNATGGQFQVNNVERGFTVFNSSTGAMATVLSVASDIQLTSQVLSGGSRATWLNTDGYVIYDNVQCNISGGNLVAIDDVGASISSVLQSPNTNVVRTSSSSATLSSIEVQNQQRYGGLVHIASDGVAGTEYPIGTHGNSVNNIDDALVIAETYICDDLHFETDFTIANGDDITKKKLSGHQNTITLESGCITEYCIYTGIIVTGALGGVGEFNNATLLDATNVEGRFVDTQFKGDIYFKDSTSSEVLARRCSSGPDVDTNFHAGDCFFFFTNWSAHAKLYNKTSAETCGFLMGPGTLFVDASCTAGGLHVGGQGKLTDNSNGTTVTSGQLIDSTDVAKAAKALKTGEFIALK